MLGIVLIGIFGIVVLLGSLWAYRAGQYKKFATREAAINDAVQKAAQYRDRLRRDHSYAERVRKYFQRR